jgi:hypothetical protein
MLQGTEPASETLYPFLRDSIICVQTIFIIQLLISRLKKKKFYLF